MRRSTSPRWPRWPRLGQEVPIERAPLRAALADYLLVRRSLGFKLTRDGLLLEQFVAFCEHAGAERVTRELAIAWVTSPKKASPSCLTMRLGVVRGLASWLQAADPATEVPERGRLPSPRRTNPYLYTEAEVAALMEAARHARWPLSAATYETLIGLLAVTGMRIGEAIRLDRDDLSLTTGCSPSAARSSGGPASSSSTPPRCRHCGPI